MPLAIVHEDEDLIVLDKPAGLVVHPAPGHHGGTLVNALIAHCGASLSGIGGVKRPGIVHRLDKDTSGLMVVAKTLEAHHALARAIAAREVKRDYLALVHGDVPRGGEVDAPIGRDPRQRTRMAVLRRGKPARTRYEVLQRYEEATLLKCSLDTGRTHQIRVHLRVIGHPLVGDPVYGRRSTSGLLAAFPRQALHAAHLAFAHPTSGERLDFESRLPHDLAGLLAALAPA